MGERTLLVVTTNVGDMENGKQEAYIAERLKSMKIDIETIRETHRIIDGEWEEGGIRLLHNCIKEE